MRKLTLEITTHEMKKKEEIPMFELIHSYEILETLKIDWEGGICVDLIECNMNEGVSIHDLTYIGDMEILSILKSEGNKHTCLIRSYEREESLEFFREFDLDLIYSNPLIITKEKIIVSVIGENDNLTRFIELMRKHAGTIDKMTFKKATYQKQDVLSALTEKQRDIIITAHKSGYYNYPKKITSEKLAKKIDISKGTMVEHLRKAEGRILGEILAGYSG